MEPRDDPELGSSNEEGAEPLGLANPLLPPEPLGQNLLYPQFLVPVATEPLTATNPSMFFPGGIPGYQPPENPFQELPFFAEARASLRTGQALGLPEVVPGTRRVPRPILSDLLGDLEFQTDFEAPAASPEPTTNEIEIAEVPTLEEGFEVTEEREIQPIPPEEVEEVELPTIPEIETQELVETLPETELSHSSPESSSNPLSVPAVSEENFVADASPAEPIAAELALQKTELVEPEPTVAFSSVSEELGSPAVPQTEESTEETEPAVVPELPELIEQPSDLEVTVSPEVELSEETEIPEPITANSPPPELAEILTESAAESIAPEPLPVTPTTASTIVSDLEQTTPESEEVSESPELTEVQSKPEALEELEPTTPEPENTELIQVEAAVSPEGELPEAGPLLPVAESAAEENESLPELTNESPVSSTEEVAVEEEATAEIVEPPISNPEIIAAAIEEPVAQELVGSIAESTPFLAEAELTSPVEAETPLSMAVSAEIEPVEELENTEQFPSSEASLAVPVEVIPKGEPLAAEQNQSEAAAVSAEPLAATPQEIVVPEAEQNPENQPESESSPPISRIQELVEQQIEAFSGLEQEEVREEEATAPESAVPTVIEEGAQPASGEESIPLEIPPEVATTEMAAPSLEIPIVTETESESAPLQSNVELPVTQPEANVEAALSLPTVLENLGVLAPLSTLSPLTQLTNFLPVAEPFAAQRREGISLGLEQPMTFASPPSTSSISSPLTQRANFLPVAEPFISEQREGIPLGLEQPMTFASITPPPSLESSSSTTPNFPGPNEKLDLPAISDASSSTADSSTGTESSISQEEHPSFSEAMSSLPVVSTLPVMRNDGIFTPLTFAQRSIDNTHIIDNTPINEQERGSSHSLSIPDIPQEWSSIEEFINSNPSIERDGFNSLFLPEVPIVGNGRESGGYTPEISNFMPSRSLESDEEQNFISESISLDNMNEEILNTQGENDEDTSLDELNEDTENEIDLEILAQEIYGLLQQRLVIERERQGFYTGRLPW
jgi:hypothetical protein